MLDSLCPSCLKQLHGKAKGRYLNVWRTYCGRRCRTSDRKWLRRRRGL